MLYLLVFLFGIKGYDFTHTEGDGRKQNNAKQQCQAKLEEHETLSQYIHAVHTQPGLRQTSASTPI